MGTLHSLRSLHATIHDRGEDAISRFEARHNAFYTRTWTPPLERTVGASLALTLDRAHERFIGVQYEAVRRFLHATR